MRVLVTGASGFVGGAVARALAEQEGAEVLGVARARGIEGNGLQIAFADVAERSDVEGLGRSGRFDVIVHSAGLAHRFGSTDPNDFIRVNVKGTRNVARLASEQRSRFILMSSVSVYGDHGAATVDEDAECRPRGAYAISKLESESEARALVPESDLLILRLATVVGPGDPGNAARLITQIMRRRFLQVGPGTNLKTFIDIGDLAANAALLATSWGVCGTFNAAAEPVSVRDVLSAIREALGRKHGSLRVPAAPFVAALKAARGITGLGAFGRADDMLRKWLSDDIYSGSRFRSLPGVKAATSVLESIADETRYLASRR